MATHGDLDHRRREFIRELEIRGEVMQELGLNAMAQDKPLRKTRIDGIQFSEQEAESTGILRISIGGGGPDVPVIGDYCTIRGDQGKCIALLERVIAGLKKFED
jgi:hypothetical protein